MSNQEQNNLERLKKAKFENGGSNSSSLAPFAEQSPSGENSRENKGDFMEKIKSVFSGNKAVTIMLALVGVLGIGVVLVTVLSPKPEEVRVTNITDRSATVSWTTKKPSKGNVLYSEQEGMFSMLSARMSGQVAYDDRDVSKAELETVGEDWEKASRGDYKVSKQGKYYVHHVTVKDLEPEKTYYFKVGNGVIYKKGELVKEETITFNMSADNSFKTVKEPKAMLAPNPSYGKVMEVGEKVVEDMEVGEKVVEDGVVYMME